MLTAYDQHPYFAILFAVDDRVGEVSQRIDAATIIRRGPESGVLNQQRGNSLELVKKSARELCATFFSVELRRFKKVQLGTPM